MKAITLTIGAWNVRTIMDSSGSDRPQRRTALVGRELDRYKVKIAALNETLLAEEGLLKEVGAGYTFFWSGRKKEERREAGVGFAIKSHLVSKLSKGINDRLMTLRLPLSGKRHATIVSTYASTMTNPDLKTSSMMIWILWFLEHPEQTNSTSSGTQCQSGLRLPYLGRSDWIWRCREMHQQWTPSFKEVCRAWITDHQHSLPYTSSQKDIMGSCQKTEPLPYKLS